MATWAIGDIQGCWETLGALLDRIGFDAGEDTLWLAGDLVNRGPASLEVLRFAAGLGEACEAVIGNHDLNLLAIAAGLRDARPGDTFDEILAAPDAGALIDWLRRRPLMVTQGGYVMLHAGLLPAWTLDDAFALAAEAERALRGDDWVDFLATVYPDGRPGAHGASAAADFLATVTYVRCVKDDGLPLHGFTGPPEAAPAGARPWYEGRHDDATFLFGHWASQGHRRGNGWVALDSGCVWGETLTAYRLEDGASVQEPARERRSK